MMHDLPNNWDKQTKLNANRDTVLAPWSHPVYPGHLILNVDGTDVKTWNIDDQDEYFSNGDPLLNAIIFRIHDFKD